VHCVLSGHATQFGVFVLQTNEARSTSAHRMRIEDLDSPVSRLVNDQMLVLFRASLWLGWTP
jgi:hypothetical protein